MSVAVLLPAVLIVVSGCATKGWVNETLAKKEAEIDQRVDTVGQRVDTVDGRVTQEMQGVDARFGTLEGSVSQVNEVAKGARETSGSALAKADDTDRRLTRLWTNRHNPRLVDTVQVFFGFDRSELDDRAQTALITLVRDLQSNPNLVVELTGFTDTRGAREYDYQLSQKRVESVRRYLVEKGIQLSRIQALGLGPIADQQGPAPQKRRVSAKLMLEQD